MSVCLSWYIGCVRRGCTSKHIIACPCSAFAPRRGAVAPSDYTMPYGRPSYCGRRAIVVKVSLLTLSPVQVQAAHRGTAWLGSVAPAPSSSSLGKQLACRDVRLLLLHRLQSTRVHEVKSRPARAQNNPIQSARAALLFTWLTPEWYPAYKTAQHKLAAMSSRKWAQVVGSAWQGRYSVSRESRWQAV